MNDNFFNNIPEGKSVSWQNNLGYPGANNGFDIMKDNIKIVDGPFNGEHVGYNPLTGEQFYAGHNMPRNNQNPNGQKP